MTPVEQLEEASIEALSAYGTARSTVKGEPLSVEELCKTDAYWRLSIGQVEGLLNTQSGLLGLSGLTNDMRVLLEELELHEDHRVRVAIDVFCYRVRKYIGTFLSGMGGADALIFTGGIGENSPAIRERMCSGLEWAGLRLDRDRNQMLAAEGAITAETSTLPAYVIPTDEELLIARDTVRVILGQPHPS